MFQVTSDANYLKYSLVQLILVVNTINYKFDLFRKGEAYMSWLNALQDSDFINWIVEGLVNDI